MADRSVLFRTSTGAFQDFAQTDVLLAAGVKHASGSITIDASAGIIFNTGGSTHVIIQASGRLDTTADSTHPAVRIGSMSGDPLVVADGDIWYDTGTGKFRARENGANVDIIGGGGDTSAQDVWRLSMLHQVAG